MNRKRTALLIAFFITLTTARLLQDTSRGSTYSPKEFGTKAILMLLEELGHTSGVWRRPFNELDFNGTLVVISPRSNPHFKKLHSWLFSGNTLITFGAAEETISYLKRNVSATLLSTEATDSEEEEEDKITLSDRLGNLSISPLDPAELSCAHEFSELCLEATTISALPTLITEKSSSAMNVLAYADSAPALLHFKVGKGEVYIVPSADIILNRNIDRFDNLNFIYHVLTHRLGKDPTASRKIVFDEFHHGFIEAGTAEAKHRSHALWLFIGLLVSLLIFLALSRSIRFGPPLPETPRPPAGTAELAKALGLLAYQRETVSMLPNYISSWRVRLEKRFNISARIDEKLLSKKLAQRGIITEDEAPLLSEALEKLSQPALLTQAKVEHYIADLEDIIEGEKAR